MTQSVVRDLKKVVRLFLLWRVSLFAFAFVGTNFTRERFPNHNKDYQAFPNHYFLDGFFRWDSGWYARIAERGYYIEGQQSNVVFFPLYPYLSRFLGFLLGDHFLAGFVISNVATLFALFYVYRIGRMFFADEEAERTLVLLLLFPGSLFFAAYYSEGLFLLCAAASVYYFLSDKYLLAGIAGFFAMLTRSTGLLLFVVFVGYLVWEIARRRRRWSPAQLWLLLIPLGIAVFMLILHIQVGDAWAFARYQEGWGRSTSLALLTPFAELMTVDPSFPRDAQNMQRLVDVLCAFGLLAVGVFMALSRMHPVLWVFVLGSALMPLATGKVMSMMRFAGVSFPAFFYLAHLAKHRSVERLLVYSFSFFLSLYLLLFINWYWAG